MGMTKLQFKKVLVHLAEAVTDIGFNAAVVLGKDLST